MHTHEWVVNNFLKFVVCSLYQFSFIIDKILAHLLPGLPQVRKCLARKKKKILQGQGKVKEFYFEQGKADILRKDQGKLKELIP